ncbi:low affinity immunoglobulin epsilon Fc receptor-like [Physella acuta]|uniref:low affinity immunoglobulin epsilon Fc receptor-like n=1 Tax=Physella acuta TaxID=109671 RepID=UPI0027DE6011|nr:low affinity immunoglobulin epsilon Fc receptor-like [Physella acuta]
MWTSQLSQLVVSVSLLFIIDSPGAVGSDLWNGGKVVDGKCFLMVREEATWTSALSACHYMGGTLATITSLTQLAALRAAFNIYDRDFWIGANDLTTEGTFVWTEDLSSASVIYSWWDVGSPDIMAGNIFDCVQMRQNNMVLDHVCNGYATFYMCMEPNSRTTKCIAPTTTEDVTTATTETTTLSDTTTSFETTMGMLLKLEQ